MTVVSTNATFGLLAALFWGGGDFSGGMAAKHAGGKLESALRIILVSHSLSLCILLALALVRGDKFPHGTPFLWGISAGAVGGLSIAFFYVALARGAMGAAAAISGLLAAAIPALVAIAAEGSPGPTRLSGFLIAGIAIWMVAAAPEEVLDKDTGPSDPKPVTSTALLAVISGAGFGIYFVALKMAGAVGVVWPMAIARTGSITTCGLFALCMMLTTRTMGKSVAPIKLAKRAVLWAFSAAILDTCGNLLFICATRTGRLDVAAVLASLYPATTILLAALLLKERFSLRQRIGMAVAALAVVTITL